MAASASRTGDGWLNADFRRPCLQCFSARHELPRQRLSSEVSQLPSGFGRLPSWREMGGVSDGWDGSVAFWTHPRIHPKLRRLTRKYRCLGGIPCAVKLLKVKVRCRLTRKRSLVRIKSFWLYLSMVYGFRNHSTSPQFRPILFCGYWMSGWEICRKQRPL